MADLKGTNVAALIVPFTDQDPYATHDAKYGKGGFRSVDTIAERNAITTERKTTGMIVHVNNLQLNYRWTGTAWAEWKPKGSIAIDAALSTTSTNPVQNKIITARIDNLDTTLSATTTLAQGAYTVATAAIPKANIDTILPEPSNASDARVPSTKSISTMREILLTAIQLIQNSVDAVEVKADNAIPKSKIDTSIDGNETDNTTVPGTGAIVSYIKTANSGFSIQLSNMSSRITTVENWKNTIGVKGAANGVAGLDASGKVPSSQLPSYVDDIVDVTNFVTSNPTSGMTIGNVYYNSTKKKLFTATSATAGVTSDPESDKIYVRLTDSTLWRWSGSTMGQVNGGLVLGTTSTTAFRGDFGNTLYTNFGSGTNLTGTQDARDFFSKAKTYIPLESQYVIQNLAVNPQSDYVKIQDSILYLTGEPNSGDGFKIPAANSTKAGVMTAEMYKTLQEIELATFPLSLTASGGGTWEVGSSTKTGIAISVLRKGVNVTADSTIQVTASSGSGSLSSNKSTWTPSAAITSNTSVAVKATYGSQTATKTASYAFKYKKYWGTSASATLTNANILALTGNTWANSRAMNATNFDCTGGKYPYYVIPASIYTGLEVWVGGLKNTDIVVSDITLTNASGASAAYKVIRLANKQTGVLSIQFL